MLRFVASLFTSNTAPDDSNEPVIYVTSTETGEEEDITPIIQSLRQQKQQELEQKALLRRITHQSVMNHYAQDHLPLSQLQEKLNEDNLPLIELKDKLNQQQRDDLAAIYTTTKENINFLLYNNKQPTRTKSRRRRPILSALINRKNKNSNSNDDSNAASTTEDDRDDRDYDVWDDAIIGRLMNLVDKMNMEEEGITPKAEIEEEIKEEPLTSVNDKSTCPEESTEDTIENETKVAESAAAVENNVVENVQENVPLKIAQEIINFDDTVNVADSLAAATTNPLTNKRSVLPKTDSGYGENSILTNNTKRRSRFLGRHRSKLSLKQSHPSSSDNVQKTANLPESLKRNLSRKSSIHSKNSYRSSLSSKFSINTTTSVIIEEPNDDGSDNVKFRNKFFTSPRSQKSNKPIRFLRNLWKSNQNISDNGEILPNKETMEQRNDDAYQHLSDRELKKLQRSGVEGNATTETIGTDGQRSDPDYSNFYLAMPNGKWMVRTRTASRKITGTQYVDKEHI